MEYVELHAHSNFSLLDGACFPGELVEAARTRGMTALALTDHNGLYGVPRFCRSARAAGIKPIVGVELTLDDARHITLLVKDARGYGNLSRLVTRAQLSGSKEPPPRVCPCCGADRRPHLPFRLQKGGDCEPAPSREGGGRTKGSPEIHVRLPPRQSLS